MSAKNIVLIMLFVVLASFTAPGQENNAHKGNVAPYVELSYDGLVALDAGGTAELPLRVESDMIIGGVTLMFSASRTLRIDTARMAFAGAPPIDIVHDRDGRTRLYWSSLESHRVPERGVLMTITVSAAPDFDGHETMLEMTDDCENEIGDPDGHTLPHARILLPSVARSAERPILAVYPNPVRDAATITFDVPYDAMVTLTLHDMLGRVILELAKGMLTGGRHTLAMEAAALPPGTCILRMVMERDGRRVMHERRVDVKR